MKQEGDRLVSCCHELPLRGQAWVAAHGGPHCTPVCGRVGEVALLTHYTQGENEAQRGKGAHSSKVMQLGVGQSCLALTATPALLLSSEQKSCPRNWQWRGAASAHVYATSPLGPQGCTSCVSVWTSVTFLNHSGRESNLWLRLEAMARSGWAGRQAGRPSSSLCLSWLLWAGPGPAIVLGTTPAPQGPGAA